MYSMYRTNSKRRRSIECALEIKLIVCGIRISQIYESTSLSVKECEGDYWGTRPEKCLQLQYRVLVESDTKLLKQDYINRVLGEEGDLFIESLSLLLRRPSQLISYKAKLDGAPVEIKLPPQDAPLGLYNLAAKWNWRPLTYGYSSLVHSDGWPLLESLIDGFHQKPMSLRNQLALPLRWFAKGCNEMTSIDRLVALWISFNALYEDSRIKGEQKAIECYIEHNIDCVIAKRYVDKNEKLLRDLSKLPIVLRGGARQIAQELKKALDTNPKDYTAIITTAVLTIYGIRNNLFHGACDLNSESDRRQIEIGEYLLSPLVSELIAKQMLGEALPTTKFVIEERFSR
jgi:hypothetical protein